MPTLMSTASPGSRMERAEAASTPVGILTEVEGARRAASCRDSDVVAMLHKFRDANPRYFTIGTKFTIFEFHVLMLLFTSL